MKYKKRRVKNKQVIDLKESTKGFIGEFGGRKRKEKMPQLCHNVKIKLNNSKERPCEMLFSGRLLCRIEAICLARLSDYRSYQIS